MPFEVNRTCSGAKIAERKGTLCTKHSSDAGGLGGELEPAPSLPPLDPAVCRGAPLRPPLPTLGHMTHSHLHLPPSLQPRTRHVEARC